jgi:arabinan endo-1,5-alpha-L-arabinosidase
LRTRGLAFVAALLAVPVSGQTTDVGIHDPVVIEEGGTYYAFATGRGIAVWSSPDLGTWERLPPVFAEPPAWASEVVEGFRGSIWAPDITQQDGVYHLYYSVSAFGRNTSAIGHATNVTLDPESRDFEWVDQGMIVQSVPGRDMWNAIDPNIGFDDEGTPWMVFGSFWSGMKLFRLAPDMNAPAAPPDWRTVAARPRYWAADERSASDGMMGGIEAPFIFRKDGWYYLFVSWDRCCAGAESTYKVVVGRSRDITGPYLDRKGLDMRYGGGSLVATGDGEHWAAVGHSAAYTFDGMDYFVAHAYDLTDDGRSKLVIREFNWDEEGWPSVTID